MTKLEKLQKLIRDRNISGTVYFSRKWPIGWMHDWHGGCPQRLGYNYRQAVELIEHGTMDFLAGKCPPKLTEKGDA